jgi:hypothetical protein
MTVTVGQIKAEFPEFVNTSAELIGYKLADAERVVGGAVFGELRDDAVKYYACHLIALAPHGEFARLVESTELGGASTTYERQYLKLVRSAVTGPIVT